MDLGSCFEVHAGIALRQQFEIDKQFEIPVLTGARHVDALAVIDEFSVVDRPVFESVFPLRIKKLLPVFLRHLVELVRVLAVSNPAVEVFPVEQGLETLRGDVVFTGRVCGDRRRSEQQRAEE